MPKVLLATIAALALAGCASARVMTWARADGSPFQLNALDVSKTICTGETQKSNLQIRSDDRGLFTGSALRQVYNGCMAQQGWVQVRADQ